MEHLLAHRGFTRPLHGLETVRFLLLTQAKLRPQSMKAALVD